MALHVFGDGYSPDAVFLLHVTLYEEGVVEAYSGIMRRDFEEVMGRKKHSASRFTMRSFGGTLQSIWLNSSVVKSIAGLGLIATCRTDG